MTTAPAAVSTALQLSNVRKLYTMGDGSDVVAADLVPWLVLLSVALVATSLVNTSLAELRILLAELVHGTQCLVVVEQTG